MIEESQYKLLSLISLEITQTRHEAESDAFRTTSAKCHSNVLTRVVFLQTLSSSHVPELLLLRRYMRDAVDASLLGTLLDLEDPALLVGIP